MFNITTKIGGFYNIVARFIAVETESIVFNNVSFSCLQEPSEQGNVTGSFTVVNGSGNYFLQVFYENEWLDETEVSSEFIFETVGFDDSLIVRIIDTTTQIFSNELSLELTHCPLTDTAVEILEMVDELVSINFINAYPIQLDINGIHFETSPNGIDNWSAYYGWVFPDTAPLNNTFKFQFSETPPVAYYRAWVLDVYGSEIYSVAFLN